MTKKTQGRTILSRLLKDRFGNFAMVTAVTIPVILAAGGVAIDMTKMVLAKAELQDATDAAALAAASALANEKKTATQAKQIAEELFAMQISGTSGVVKEGDTTIVDAAPIINISQKTTESNGKIYNIDITATYSVKFSAFTRMLGHDGIKLTAKSFTESATESKNALSMYLVLDKSGSMLANTNEKIIPEKSCTQYNDSGSSIGTFSPCYIKKIEALKLAAASLFTQLNAADPKTMYVRTGTVSYNSSMSTASNLVWGTGASLTQVNALSAGGGTASGAAMEAAYNKLKASTENDEHKKKNGQVPTKYIILMTDGNNNNTSDDTKTKDICAKAKADGMVVYGVAFMAPTRGQQLLKACVSEPGNYFAAEKMDQLVAAFKAIGERAAAIMSRLTK
ncbi:VWA domain-containing protein [Shinella sp. AETb1-6]|jgi:Flp pilus assembly protein TadG|uniref:vWA domain-containing protein n=1 Tax=Shinella sp. AETb1-6 TaxID=2692210 RepID=UPI00136DD78F|nr:VWA domain-containing protein [Shinella sp. AETb1-6]MDP9590256.1 Flp pilus assembly protein TadG [Shinella zoogloeoides]MXN52311.1 VWA domain-containing protein [Shinella sp. AETb1-6]